MPVRGTPKLKMLSDVPSPQGHARPQTFHLADNTANAVTSVVKVKLPKTLTFQQRKIILNMVNGASRGSDPIKLLTGLLKWIETIDIELGEKIAAYFGKAPGWHHVLSRILYPIIQTEPNGLFLVLKNCHYNNDLIKVSEELGVEKCLRCLIENHAPQSALIVLRGLYHFTREKFSQEFKEFLSTSGYTRFLDYDGRGITYTPGATPSQLAQS